MKISMKVRIKNKMALLQSVLKEGLIIINKFIIIDYKIPLFST
jgi:hypothetical protein